MALRNAFENLATEAKQDGIISILRMLVKSTTYARTNNDVMRVVVDSGGSLSTTTYWGSGGSLPAWYGTGAPTALDAREQQMVYSNIAVTQAMQRWTVT